MAITHPSIYLKWWKCTSKPWHIPVYHVYQHNVRIPQELFYTSLLLCIEVDVPKMYSTVSPCMFWIMETWNGPLYLLLISCLLCVTSYLSSSDHGNYMDSCCDPYTPPASNESTWIFITASTMDEHFTFSINMINQLLTIPYVKLKRGVCSRHLLRLPEHVLCLSMRLYMFSCFFVSSA